MLDKSNIPLAGAPFTWFVAGGWALDLFLGRQTRPHADLDLGIFRNDQSAFQSFLSGYSFSKMLQGELVDWEASEQLSLPVHETRAKSPTGGTFEILFSEANESHWIYRRNPKIMLPLSSAVLTAAEGVPVLAPEIILLFKSKSPREKDQLDFDNVRSRLSSEQKRWLVDALNTTEKLHPWAATLFS